MSDQYRPAVVRADGKLGRMPMGAQFEDDLMDSGERELIHVSALVTASGDTPVYAPPAGKRIRLRWVYALNDPAALAPARIAVKLGVETLYLTYGISKRQRKTGATDAALVISLSTAGSVAVSATLEVVDP